jgi:hypothetical protein
MKLFELYDNSALTGANNLKAIARAIANKTSAKIVLGENIISLPYHDARYVYNLYNSSLKNNSHDKFMQQLSNIANARRITESSTLVMENENTMRHIISRFKHEVKSFMNGEELSTDLYHALYDYYVDHGEMPYGTAKARDGDPYEWVTHRFDRDVNDYTGEGMDPDVPQLPTAELDSPAIESFSALGEAGNPWLNLGKDDRPNYGKRSTSTGEVEYKPGVTIHRAKKRYGGEDSDYDAPEPKGDEGSGEPAPTRGRGRPSAVTSQTEEGTKVADYSSWYHKSKRTYPERRIAGGRAKAIAVVPKGAKYQVVGEWTGESGIVLANLGKLMTAKEIEEFKSDRGRPRTRTAAADSTPKTRGRPKKVREWIETLKFVAEGEKTETETGIKHKAKGAYGADDKEEKDPLDKLDKSGTNKIEKAIGVKFKDGKKK